jgi:signal transduction histidine kinase
LAKSEQQYRSLFEGSPVSLWLEDFSAVKAELESLALPEAELSALLDARPDVLQRLATQVRVLDINRATLDVYRAQSKAALLADISRVFGQESYAAFKQGVLALVRGDRSFAAETTTRRLDGTSNQIAIRWMAAPGHETTWSRVVVSVVDLTAQHAAEAEQRRLFALSERAERLESLGLLAGGVAHDFNNLLVGVLGNASACTQMLSAEHAAQPLLAEIGHAAKAARELTRQLLTFAGHGEQCKGQVELDPLVREMAPLCQKTIGHKVRLAVELGAAGAMVEADASQLRQAVLNLVVNAADASVDRGTPILVRTGREYCCAERMRSLRPDAELPAGDYVVIEVVDSGTGMDQETLARAFEPFFSTKGHGRGLGLSAVHGVVRRQNGAISLESEPGRGSIFRMYFPVSASALVADATVGVSPTEWRGHGRVLMIDDDPLVRRAAARILSALGFEVVEAASGREGVAYFAAEYSRLRLVLLDYRMPGEDGLETLEALRRCSTDVPVVMQSGYTEAEAITSKVGAAIAAFLPKPFDLQELETVLRRVLGP